MAGPPPTATPSFMMIFLTRTTRPVPTGGSAGISSHLPRVTKHPCCVDIRGSPGASRVSGYLAPKRLNRTGGLISKPVPCWKTSTASRQFGSVVRSPPEKLAGTVKSSGDRS